MGRDNSPVKGEKRVGGVKHTKHFLRFSIDLMLANLALLVVYYGASIINNDLIALWGALFKQQILISVTAFSSLMFIRNAPLQYNGIATMLCGMLAGLMLSGMDSFQDWFSNVLIDTDQLLAYGSATQIVGFAFVLLVFAGIAAWATYAGDVFARIYESLKWPGNLCIPLLLVLIIVATFVVSVMDAHSLHAKTYVCDDMSACFAAFSTQNLAGSILGESRVALTLLATTTQVSIFGGVTALNMNFLQDCRRRAQEEQLMA